MSDANTLEHFARDIERTAELVGAPFDPAVIRQTLEIFAAGFGSCPVELRTTSPKPGSAHRELSFRYIDADGSHDPYQLALQAGVLGIGGRPVDRLIPELRERFPIFGYGVDASASAGFEKLWPFFDRPYPLEALAELSSLPESLARVAPWLQRHGFIHVATIAADFRHATTNLYFPHPAFAEAPQRLAALLSELGSEQPSAAELEYFSHAGIVGVTLSWASDVVERICCYVTVDREDALWLPDDPVLRAVAARTPIRTTERRFVVGATYGRRGAYTKLEIDYTGTSVPLMERWLARLDRKAASGPRATIEPA